MRSASPALSLQQTRGHHHPTLPENEALLSILTTVVGALLAAAIVEVLHGPFGSTANVPTIPSFTRSEEYRIAAVVTLTLVAPAVWVMLWRGGAWPEPLPKNVITGIIAHLRLAFTAFGLFLLTLSRFGPSLLVLVIPVGTCLLISFGIVFIWRGKL